MNPKISLLIIMIISIAGIAFSGYFSYQELILKTCPTGGCTNLFGIPVCIYGLVMYLLVFIISILGLKSRRYYT